jgi:FtsZ-binding cell division protein ZapB
VCVCVCVSNLWRSRLRTEVEGLKEKRARDVLAVMQQRDEVMEEVDSLREINEALRNDLTRLKAGERGYPASHVCMRT